MQGFHWKWKAPQRPTGGATAISPSPTSYYRAPTPVWAGKERNTTTASLPAEHREVRRHGTHCDLPQCDRRLFSSCSIPAALVRLVSAPPSHGCPRWRSATHRPPAARISSCAYPTRIPPSCGRGDANGPVESHERRRKASGTKLRRAGR